MMRKCYTIRDLKANTCVDPFCASSNGEAVRMVKHTLHSGQGMIAEFPSDFELLCVGSFDTEKGALSAVGVTSLGLLSDYVDKPVQAPLTK